MNDSTGLEIMRVTLGLIARVHALEHTTFVLMATHPFPEVALATWDASHPSWAERGFAQSDMPEYRDVLSRMMAEHRATLASAAEQAAKQ